MRNVAFAGNHWLGFPMDGTWATHVERCVQCREAYARNALADLCLDGAILWKQDQPRPKATKTPRPVTLGLDGKPERDYHATRAELKKVTRYKGES
jgi:hypothetical protein